MNLAIIKYNAGNIRSVLNAIGRLDIQAEVTDDPEKIRSADRVIFPGVGEAGSAMKSLRQNGLDAVIKDLKQPVLGICVGMQLLCDHSEEGNTDCLGIIPIAVKKFDPSKMQADRGEDAYQMDPKSTIAEAPLKIKVPQVGWNQIYGLRSGLFNQVDEGSFIYNVHSYYAEDSPFTIATCRYGIEYAAAVCRDNFYGVQFHAEKSAEVGDRIIKNFIEG
jgi:glutamine amidotransferase